MNISIPGLLVNDGFITPGDREKIENFSARTELSFIKIALTYGYISRKNYERSMSNAGFDFKPIREEKFDREVLDKIELAFADAHMALPLRIEKKKVVVLMADPSDRLFLDFIRMTYNMEPEIIVADDLDITWMSHRLLGESYVKSAVFELLNHDVDSSALTTFTTGQLVFIFVILGALAAGLVLNFKSVSVSLTPQRA